MAVIGGDKVVADLRKFLRNFENAADEFGQELRKSVVDAIFKEEAIDTAAMVIAIDYTRSFVVDGGATFFLGTVDNPEVFYDGFAELPTRNRDGSMRRGRYFYKQGIENAKFGNIIENIADRSFVI